MQKSKVNRLLRFFLLYIGILLLQFSIGRVVEIRNKRLSFYNNVISELTSISESFSNDLGKFGATTSFLKEFQTKDIRIANLKYFFRKYNSILYDKADIFVQNADTYNFDYRLLPAIAMQESGLCKHIPENSYNCWGWGIYGGKVTRFTSYEEAIETISRGIKMHYIDKGLTTPEQIMKKYTPPSDGSWAYGVNTFLNIIE